MDYAAAIRTYIIDNFLFDDDDSLQVDTSFLDNGIVDSTGIMELVTFVEKTFGINVEDKELIPDNFDSIQDMANFLKAKLNGN